MAADGRFTPVYFKIQQHLRTGIASGELGPGDRLPSESELSRAFSTTRSTVRHALSLLVFEGLIVREIGRGTFVATPSAVTSAIDTRQCQSFEDQVALSGKTVTYRAPSFVRMKAPSDVAEQLALGTDGERQVYRLERLRVIDGRPTCLEIRYFPSALGDQVRQDMLWNRSVHDFLSEIIGERIPTIIVSVLAMSADAKIASMLEIPRGSALTVREHSYRDKDGKALLCGRSIFRGDVRLEYVLGEAPRWPPGA